MAEVASTCSGSSLTACEKGLDLRFTSAATIWYGYEPSSRWRRVNTPSRRFSVCNFNHSEAWQLQSLDTPPFRNTELRPAKAPYTCFSLFLCNPLGCSRIGLHLRWQRISGTTTPWSCGEPGNVGPWVSAIGGPFCMGSSGGVGSCPSRRTGSPRPRPRMLPCRRRHFLPPTRTLFEKLITGRESG